MNSDYMAKMSAEELDELARYMGVSIVAAKSAESKARMIQEKRSRVARVGVLGIEFEIPMKRVRDKRVSDLLEKKTDASTEEAVRLLVGDDKFAELVGACTDEDGTVDVDAMGYAIAKIMCSDELKNY